jgi:drug/metabolite transporter (DMT)-like permease
VLLLGEQPNERLLGAGLAILGGIALALLRPQRRSE